MSLKAVYRMAMLKEASIVATNDPHVASAERVKRRMMEAKNQQSKSLIDALEAFINDASKKSSANVINSARNIAAMVPAVAEMYDSPADTKMRAALSDLFVWLSAIDTAPLTQISASVKMVKEIYEEISAIFSAGE